MCVLMRRVHLLLQPIVLHRTISIHLQVFSLDASSLPLHVQSTLRCYQSTLFFCILIVPTLPLPLLQFLEQSYLDITSNTCTLPSFVSSVEQTVCVLLEHLLSDAPMHWSFCQSHLIHTVLHQAHSSKAVIILLSHLLQESRHPEPQRATLQTSDFTSCFFQGTSIFFFFTKRVSEYLSRF